MSATPMSTAFHSPLKTARSSELTTSALFSALVIVLSTLCWGARSQIATPTSVTKADAQKVLKTISSDKAKTRIYCQMSSLGGQLLQANERRDSKKVDELFEQMYEMEKKLGSEYIALIDGLQDIDPESEIGHEISSTLDALDNLCAG